MVKGYYLARICYNDEFKEEMKFFLDNISVDENLENISKNKNQRFSLAIRELIKWYNGRRRKILLEKARGREDATDNDSD